MNPLRRALSRMLPPGPPPAPPAPATAPGEPITWQTWTDDLSDGTLARMDDAALTELGEHRAQLELKLAADRSSAELAAAKRKLTADYARERTRLQAEAAARNSTRDEQAAARAAERAKLQQAARELEAAREAKQVERASRPLPAHYSPSALGLAVRYMLAAWGKLLFWSAAMLLAVAMTIGPGAAGRMAHAIGSTMGAGIGVLWSGGQAGPDELREAFERGRQADVPELTGGR